MPAHPAARSPIRGRWRVLAAVTALALLIAAPELPTVSAGPAVSAGTTPIAQFDAHISHIIFLMQENHAFDNLFGVYCPAKGAYCTRAADAIPAGACIPVVPSAPQLGCQPPFNFSAAHETLTSDLPHDWNASHNDYNHGAMNGFVYEDGTNSAGHYNGSTVPVYYDLAEEYGLADDFFSGSLSYSLPNHWYMVAADAPAVSQRYRMGPLAGAANDKLYLAQSNATPSIETQLLTSSVSWKFYDTRLNPYSSAIRVGHGSAYNYWNPLEGQSQSYRPRSAGHFVGRTSFFADAAAGTLPDLSWIIPTANNSDHPTENLTVGESWVAAVVDAVEASPEWNSTLLLVSWDEFGGFYDHVRPPTLDANGDGFRVPLLAIGPWVRQGYLDGQNLSFESVLHLMQERFHLGCLGPRDCTAALPLSMFNFARSLPRAPIYFPPFSNATYPMPLQSSGLLPPFLGAYVPPAASLSGTEVGALATSAPSVDWS